jgi:hypothetical protein
MPVNRCGFHGTWARSVGPMLYVVKFEPEHLTITTTMATEDDDKRVFTGTVTVTADYHVLPDGKTLLGLITCVDAHVDGDVTADFFDTLADDLAELQKAATDKPFALEVRVLGGSLVIGNVRLPAVQAAESWKPMTVLGGRYTSVENKPVPQPKVVKTGSPRQLAVPAALPNGAPVMPAIGYNVPLPAGYVPTTPYGAMPPGGVMPPPPVCYPPPPAYGPPVYPPSPPVGAMSYAVPAPTPGPGLPSGGILYSLDFTVPLSPACPVPSTAQPATCQLPSPPLSVTPAPARVLEIAPAPTEVPGPAIKYENRLTPDRIVPINK